MISELPIGLALRRFRRLNMVKQSAVAERLGVSQGCVSRWESGAHGPDAGLFESGWFERPYQNLELCTGSNGRSDVPVPPGRMLWETLPLAEGRVGRLTTTIG
jgi:DNA-binding XRE family transcriptional regulator